MAAPKIVSSKKIDSAAVRELAELLNETGLTEIEYETEEHRIRVAKTAAVTMAAAPLSVPAPAAAVSSTATAASIGPTALGSPIKSPLVGTAYLAPQPGSAPFVKVGDAVSEGQTLMIVEAMKVMNPIKAPKGGKVVAIHVIDMAPVEFDEVLMEIA